MIRIAYKDLRSEFERVLLALRFAKKKADICATIFANNTLDGINSHGINRFPVFVNDVKSEKINQYGEPECVSQNGSLEVWDGHSGIGVYNASICMDRAIDIAKRSGVGAVFIKNTNHWMRGGTYGWQAANAGCIGICFTNAIAGMAPWGGTKPRLGNNPMVFAVPRNEGNVVLDMALSQFSFGKIQEYELQGNELPFDGGYDDEGNLTKDPAAIRNTQNALPIGFWKGSGMALLLDIILTSVTGGHPTKYFTERGAESDVSQAFICIHNPEMHQDLIDEILRFTQSENDDAGKKSIFYPGERTLIRRNENLLKGIPVEEEIWDKIKKL